MNQAYEIYPGEIARLKRRIAKCIRRVKADNHPRKQEAVEQLNRLYAILHIRQGE